MSNARVTHNPALMVTDTALYRDPNYHQLSDTPDQLDFERLARVREHYLGCVGSARASSFSGYGEST